MALSLSIYYTMSQVTVYLNQPVNAGRNVCWHWVVNSYKTWLHFCTGKSWSKWYETESSHTRMNTTLSTSSERGWGWKASSKKYKLDNKIKKEYIFLTNRHNLWDGNCQLTCVLYTLLLILLKQGAKHQTKYIITGTVFNASKKHLNLLQF